ncbi:MAG: di-heme oxidoredictase family protein [Thermoanaerobaculia bacterium]
MRSRGLSLFVFAGLLAFAAPSAAQLAECDQINIDPADVPGGCIARTLEDQIGTGRGDEFTESSSIYLIKRDPARSVRRGRQLFQRKFTRDEGQGPRVNSSSTGDQVTNRALGAGLSDSCAGCHGRPRGSAGHGGVVNTRPDSRDAPHLFALGIVEQLGDEMTADLRAIRDDAIEDAESGSGVILEEDFEDGLGGFVYEDDVFGTNNPEYADGDLYFSSNQDDTVIRVDLGNIDDADIFGMSGGFSQSFTLETADTLTVSLLFELRQSPDYESDEYSEAIVRIGGEEFLLARIFGNGNGGSIRSTGITAISFDVSLDAGTHTLTVGGFNNQKTLSNELTSIFYNDIVVEGSAGQPVVRPLDTKGVNFGSITAFSDGTVDTSEVEGVDEDLRVKPFFHQGGTISMREFIVGALKAEMGLEVPDPVLCAATDPVDPQKVTSPAGFVFDPAEDSFERPPVCDELEDGDGDGVTNEIDAALLDHLEFYLLNYFKPGQGRTTGFTDSGLEVMEQIGCTECHVQDLTIDSDRRVADVETVHDPVDGIFNELFATASTLFETVDDGEEFPKLLPKGDPFVVENFFSDLKRHDLGPKFHERDFDGNTVTHFVTEPLWGVGSTAPYGHDGRSMNLDAVIRRHGGEAQEARDAYVSLGETDRLAVQAFLNTLILFPPDDTASNLNPGDPDSTNPQDPANHGSINLGALFQIDSEGPE